MATLRRYPIGCTLGLLLGSWALQAAAEPPAASNNNGLMSFPNVRVVNAPQNTAMPAAASKPVAHEAGMRAYMKDGQVMEATSADAAQLSNATPTTAKATTATADVARTTASGEEILVGEDNSMQIMLGEDSMVFQVAHKDATGKLTEQCVTGADSASRALHSAAVKNQARKESRNDR